ncbi:hypothetical protein SO802_025948 [Lithocarpus litseifolius]|uniref:DUF4371 domain-containing protein n=1 Tax=Lithocarpus litseifolius TaxID=425828 RepID=A0AAW2C0A8_9ROSI
MRLRHALRKDANALPFCWRYSLEENDEVPSPIRLQLLLQSLVTVHVSAHNIAQRKCEALLNQRQSIQTVINKKSDVEKREYQTRFNASVDYICFLQRQGLAFRGHDESKDSNNQGNFLELLRFLANHNEEIDKAVLENAPKNHQMTSPDIQKEIANAAAVETINAIIKDMGDSLFAIIFDESCDMSTKEQLAIALRYVDKLGHVNERFLGITHVNNTSAVTLKSAIEEVFNKHSLSISRLRGQGYDEASNMLGELNGLKTLILKDNPSAYYVHCFAHQLQLTLVAVARNHIQIATFFNLVAKVFNIVGASCKRHDILREKQDGLDSDQRAEANILIGLLQTFEFVFDLHLMKGVLGISNELSQALQRKDQDIVNAMKLFDISKQRLQVMRDDGWNTLLEEVFAFCAKNNIDVLDMEDLYQPRPRRKAQNMKNSHHYQVELFYTVIDLQLQELNSRFENSELLFCVACLNPDNLFSAFNRVKLIRLAQFYPSDFSAVQVSFLDNQLETYIHDMRSIEEFSALKGIGQLAKKMLEMKKNVSYPLVYSLMTLALILPVATATVEKAFLAMNIINNRLRNRIGDQWMNDCLVTYIEKDIFKTIECEEIMQRFQNMKNHRGQLRKIS